MHRHWAHTRPNVREGSQLARGRSRVYSAANRNSIEERTTPMQRGTTMTPTRLPFIACCAILTLGTLACSDSSGAAEPADPVSGASTQPMAFVGVHVLTMTDGNPILEDRTVIIEGGRITDIGPAGTTPVPDEATTIDGAGRWLLPGLAEMHAHLPGPDTPDERIEDILFLYLANGVTTIRSMQGAPNHPELREATASGQILGPTIFSASPSLSGTSAPDPETAEGLVRRHAAAGYDLLKLHPGLSPETYDRIVEVAREEGITWAGHVSPEVGLERSLQTGKSTIDHLDGYVESSASPEVRARAQAGEPVPLSEVVASATPERIAELAEMTRDAGTWNVPTMYLWENFYNDVPAEELSALPEMRYATPRELEQWTAQKENRVFVELLEGWRTDGAMGADDVDAETARALIDLRREILAALNTADAGLLMGTDSPQMFMVPGFAVHHEIRVMAQAGVPSSTILESGSRRVAEYAASELGYDEDFGHVSPGARADLILVDANPLEALGALRDPAGVMVRGHWLAREELQRRLDEISERAGG
ncbi:MAG: amidohydrolase [Gemmatimonadales bacterium]|nr:MAG: amidohydrolase [Gemmatimonadales bacterium]